ncbi:MAG: hypothetical protein DRJ40_11855 [Thermoprotei archaeon]|nr:MAG: hypothetical protein DRJ40_11855 [Thermoprotei archaeon]
MPPTSTPEQFFKSPHIFTPTPAPPVPAPTTVETTKETEEEAKTKTRIETRTKTKTKPKKGEEEKITKVARLIQLKYPWLPWDLAYAIARAIARRYQLEKLVL